MAGGAAGGFLTRAFDSMLKECSVKKYPELQKAIQNYTEITKEAGQRKQAVSSEENQAAPSAESASTNETQDGAATTTDVEHLC
ncbi:hypothetical protein TanjilG_29184 [Lupinus angustifolius]|uniref:Uncharacterized protein n=1 Tax=Lupinus angustifolius TaxID=3871 RepID=A0A1J7H107_LUPAN|nr:PREDICTED: brefeldin A-inhibited guanine nucleotide-exchange protein 5-like [Lupinus angustifolius]OIW00194.1 hypothetical protein TanjilG_29184 [Lupinus angustifolius]